MKLLTEGASIRGASASVLAATVIALTASSPALAVSLNPDQTKMFISAMSKTGEKDLKALPGITPDAISKIVEFRKGGKPFSSVSQVKEISGLNSQAFDKVLEFYARMTVSPEDVIGGPGVTVPPTADSRRAPVGRRATAGYSGKTGPPPATASAETPKLDLDVQASYYSVLPGYDLAKVDPDKKKRFLDTINSETCNCGCSGETLGYCIVNDPGCPVVKSRVRKIYGDIVGAAPGAPAGSGAGH